MGIFCLSTMLIYHMYETSQVFVKFILFLFRINTSSNMFMPNKYTKNCNLVFV